MTPCLLTVCWLTLAWYLLLKVGGVRGVPARAGQDQSHRGAVSAGGEQTGGRQDTLTLQSPLSLSLSAITNIIINIIQIVRHSYLVIPSVSLSYVILLH